MSNNSNTFLNILWGKNLLLSTKCLNFREINKTNNVVDWWCDDVRQRTKEALQWQKKRSRNTNIVLSSSCLNQRKCSLAVCYVQQTRRSLRISFTRVQTANFQWCQENRSKIAKFVHEVPRYCCFIFLNSCNLVISDHFWNKVIWTSNDIDFVGSNQSVGLFSWSNPNNTATAPRCFSRDCGMGAGCQVFAAYSASF